MALTCHTQAFLVFFGFSSDIFTRSIASLSLLQNSRFVFFTSSITICCLKVWAFFLQANPITLSTDTVFHFLLPCYLKMNLKNIWKNWTKKQTKLIGWTILASGCSFLGHSVILPLIGSHWPLAEELAITINTSSITLRCFQSVFIGQPSNCLTNNHMLPGPALNAVGLMI